MEATKINYTYDKEVMIIFVTDLEQYTIQEYQVNALGYLLKPLNYQWLKELMDKCIRKQAKRISSQKTISLKGGNIMKLQDNVLNFILKVKKLCRFLYSA